MTTDKILEVVNILRERMLVVDDLIERLEAMEANEKEISTARLKQEPDASLRLRAD